MDFFNIILVEVCEGNGMVARPGFEPGSRGPEPRMLGRYTTGLLPCGDICLEGN